MTTPQFLTLHGIPDGMAAQGDSAALFTQLLKEHGDDLRAFIAAVVPVDAVRADLYQETARAMWAGFDRYDLARPFGAWARGVARHMIQRHKRWAFREASVFSPAAVEAIAAAWEAEEADEGGARLAALQECVKGLSEETREVIRYFYASREARVGGIARRMNRSVASVYQLLSRARVRLAGCIRLRLATLDDTNPPIRNHDE